MKARRIIWPVVLVLVLVVGCGRQAETPETAAPAQPPSPSAAPVAAARPTTQKAAAALTEEQLKSFLDAYPAVAAAGNEASKGAGLAHPSALSGLRTNKKVESAIKASGMSVDGFFTALNMVLAGISAVESEGSMAASLKEMEEKAQDPSLSPQQRAQMQDTVAMLQSQMVPGSGASGGVDEGTKTLIKKYRGEIDRLFEGTR